MCPAGAMLFILSYLVTHELPDFSPDTLSPWAAVVCACACLATSLPSAGESSLFFLWEIIPPLLPGLGVLLIGLRMIL